MQIEQNEHMQGTHRETWEIQEALLKLSEKGWDVDIPNNVTWYMPSTTHKLIKQLVGSPKSLIKTSHIHGFATI